MNPLTILSKVISPITNYFGKRNDNKTKVKIQQIERIKNADDSLAEWEKIQAENGSHSWKDEYWTVILSIPAIGCFFPDYVIHIENGFTALSLMPDFYQYWLGVAILTSFGIRIVKR